MVYIAIGIIAIILMLLFFVLMLILTRNSGENLNTIDNKGKILDEKGQIDKEAEAEANGGNRRRSSRASKKATAPSKTPVDPKEAIRREDVFKFMEFDRILDGMIVQRNGSRFTKAIKCKGINYDLMSDVEQLAVEEGFITFLNTLKYPIQLYVQAENIDLSGTIRDYQKNIEGLKNEYNSVNEQYQKMASSFDVDEIELQKVSKNRDSLTNVYEYALDMIKNVEKMNRNKRMLQRNFYILLSYSTSEITSVEKFNKTELIDMCSTELTTRCQAVLGALASCSVTGNVLDSNELAQLLYNAYNRDDASIMNIKDSIESGFFRLYTVSEDAFTKRQEELEDYLNDKARLKALEAIKIAIMNNSFTTPAKELLDEEEETSKRATNIINHEDYEPELKKKVNKVILDDFRNTKKALLEQDAEQKKNFLEEAKNNEAQMDSLKQKIDNYEKQNPLVVGNKEDAKPENEEQKQEDTQPQATNVQETPNVQLYNEEPINETTVNNTSANFVQEPAQQPIQPVQPVQEPVQPVQQPIQPVQENIPQQVVNPVQQPAQEIPNIVENPTNDQGTNIYETSNDDEDDDNIII